MDSDPCSDLSALREVVKFLDPSDLQHRHHRVMGGTKERICKGHLIQFPGQKSTCTSFHFTHPNAYLLSHIQQTIRNTHYVSGVQERDGLHKVMPQSLLCTSLGAQYCREGDREASSLSGRYRSLGQEGKKLRTLTRPWIFGLTQTSSVPVAAKCCNCDP